MNTAETMSEVLAEHQLCAAWEDDAGRAIICTCGIELPTEPVRGEIDMTFLAQHQAAALSAAGFGLVADAGAKALEDAADLLKPPGTLWWGDVGVTVADPPGLPFATLDEWLRARAAAVRGEG